MCTYMSIYSIMCIIMYMDECERVYMCVCVSIKSIRGGSLCKLLLSSEFDVVGFVQLGRSLLEGGGSGAAGYQVPQALPLLLQ